MASPTTLNIGEPADERSVDGSSIPFGEHSEKDDVYEGPNQTKDQHIGEFGNVSEQDMIRFQFFREECGSPGNEDDKLLQPSDQDKETRDGSISKVDSVCGIFPEFQIKYDDLLFKISPAIGAACYGYFSFSVTNPLWFGRPFGSSDSFVKDVVWVQSLLGAGFYIYSRKHVKKAKLSRGITYSVFGSLLFNFGSLVIWGWGREVFSNSPYMQLLVGAISSGTMLYLARDYLQHVDNTCSELD